MDGLSSDRFRGVHLNDIPFVEDLLTLNIVLYDIDTVDSNIIGELARRSMQKYNNTVRVLTKTYLWGAGTQFYPNLCLKITQSFFSRLKRILGNHITTTCVKFVLLLSTYTEINDWNKKLSVHSSKNGWIEFRSFPRCPFERYSFC